MLSRLLYVSERDTGADLDINQILAASRRNNGARAITGVLWFDGHFFIQVLEGNRQDISILYNKIVTDPRHRDVVLFSFATITERFFPGWNMGFLGDSATNREMMIKHCGQESFSPEKLTDTDLLTMLRELYEKQADIARAANL